MFRQHACTVQSVNTELDRPPCHFRDFNDFGGGEGLVGWLVVDLTNISISQY